MAILLDNKEITNFVNTTENVNVLSYKSIEEVHDNIFMITTHNNQTFLKEKKGDWRAKPVVEFNIHTGKSLFKNVKFVLEQRENSSINFSKFDLVKPAPRRKIVEEEKSQLMTNKPAPVQSPVVSEDVLKQHIESAILNMLGDSKSDKFTKFFELYTEGFKRDMIKYSEKIARRETYRVMESGGGTNATQYALGGTINGNLTVTGDISAGNMLTGHMSLSSLNQDGATNNQSLVWSDALQQWHPSSTSGGNVARFVSSIGNGIDSSFIINHNLNSKYLVHQIYDSATFEVVNTSIQNINDNNTVVSFSFVPPTSSYTLVTVG